MRTSIIIAGLWAAGAAWGANTACPTATGTYNSSGINVIPTTGITTAGDATTASPGVATVNTLTGVNGLGGGGGCIATDITFNNLAASSTAAFVSNGGTTAVGGSLSTAGTYVYHEVARDILMFTTTRDCNSVACGSDDTSNQFVQYQTGSVTGNILFEVTSATAFSNGSVALFLTDYLRTSSGVFTYSLFGCSGTSLTITGTPFTTCATVGGTAVTPISGSFAALTVGSGTTPVQIASGAITSGSHFYFNLSFTMNGSGNGGPPSNDINIDTYFSGIGVRFIETPEPASWLLLSAGLAMVAAMRRKKTAA